MTYHPSQGRVSKRYNRRVRYAYVTRRLKLRIAELEAVADEQARMIEWYHEKVKKAEAELAKRDNAWYDGAWTLMRKQRDEAGAEVERLREELLDSRHWPHVVENIYDSACVRCSRRVNPSGDTLGGGGRESGPDSAKPVQIAEGRSAPSAAAEPAARKERDGLKKIIGLVKEGPPSDAERASSD